MAQVITIEGRDDIGQIEFPDDYTDEQIVEAIRNNFPDVLPPPEAPPPDYVGMAQEKVAETSNALAGYRDKAITKFANITNKLKQAALESKAKREEAAKRPPEIDAYTGPARPTPQPPIVPDAFTGPAAVEPRMPQLKEWTPSIWDYATGLLPHNKARASNELAALDIARETTRLANAANNDQVAKIAKSEGLDPKQVFDDIIKGKRKDVTLRQGLTPEEAYSLAGGQRPIFNPEGRAPLLATTETAQIMGNELAGMNVPKAMANTIFRAMRGGDESTDVSWLDEAIAFTDSEEPAFIDPNYAGLYGIGESLGYSITTLAASAVVGALSGGPTPTGVAGAMATSSTIAYRATKDQFLDRVHERLNKASKTLYGRELTEEEWQEGYAQFEQAAAISGGWEAIPESIGNLIFARLLALPFKAIGQKGAMEVLTKATEALVSENVTETATSWGQSRADAEAGMGRPLTIAEAFRQQALQTNLITALMGGGGGIATKGYAMGEAQFAPGRAVGRQLTEDAANLQFAPLTDEYAQAALSPDNAQLEQVRAPYRQTMAELIAEKLRERGIIEPLALPFQIPQEQYQNTTLETPISVPLVEQSQEPVKEPLANIPEVEKQPEIGGGVATTETGQALGVARTAMDTARGDIDAAMELIRKSVKEGDFQNEVLEWIQAEGFARTALVLAQGDVEKAKLLISQTQPDNAVREKVIELLPQLEKPVTVDNTEPAVMEDTSPQTGPTAEQGIAKQPVSGESSTPSEIKLSTEYRELDKRVKNLEQEQGIDRVRLKAASISKAINKANLDDDQRTDLQNRVNAVIERETNRESTELGEPSPPTLEGTPSEVLPGAEEQRDTGTSTETGGGDDTGSSGGTGGGGVPAGRGVSDGEGTTTVPTGGKPARKPRKQPGGTTVSGGAGTAQPSTPSTGSGDRGSTEQVDREEEAAETAETPAGTTTQPSTEAKDRPPGMFTITPELGLGQGGPKAKYILNVIAIKLLKKLEAEGRQATPDEQKKLALYVGWGGIPQAFFNDEGLTTKGWHNEAVDLKELLTPEEYEAARFSTQDAHYTSELIVTEMWKKLKAMGFKGGKVLEPSVGTGNFLGLMPPGVRSKSKITGVELDNITGGIAKQLYPGANIQTPIGFEKVSVPDNYFDLVIGNPPFGSKPVYDPIRKHLNQFSIHNYFFAKSMEVLKPGGVLAMVVSNRLMDGVKNEKARSLLADQADLIGAIRLPNNAFLKNAGTQVTTDILFLRKREEGAQPGDNKWIKSGTITDKNGVDIPTNEYFIANPEMMLGEWGAFGSMYGPNEPALVAREGEDTAPLLRDALATLPNDLFAQGTPEVKDEPVELTTNVENVKIGSLFLDGDTIKQRLPDVVGVPESEEVTFDKVKSRERVRGMIQVRDVAYDLRKAQLTEGVKPATLQALRDKLNRVYDAFVKSHSFINSTANYRLFRDDPTWPQIAALEDNFDKGVTPAVARNTGQDPRPPSADKAAIFTKRTQKPYKPLESVSSAQDAMTDSLAEFGYVNMDHMVKLYNKPPEAILSELGDLIYEENEGQFVARDEYLSGNVKKKLSEAETMAALNDKYKRNVEALKKVIPADIPAIDIKVKIGSAWVPPKEMRQFIIDTYEVGDAEAVYSPANAKWTIAMGAVSVAMESKWGTPRVYARDILKAAVNGKTIVVRDRVDENTTVINEADTAAAKERIQAVKDEFAQWVWKDDARRARLARIYNDVFNTSVERKFDGSHLKLVGINDNIKLRPHQLDAIWRTMQSGATLLDHVVGAGKTFTMVASAMEMRRTGRASKSIFVVPNHLIRQWAEDFSRLYPGASVLAVTKNDFQPKNRKKLMARVALGDYDAVIIAHSQLRFIEVDPEFQKEFIEQQIRDLDEVIQALRAQLGKKARSVKQAEKQKANLEAKLEKLFDIGGKDDNLTFGELGVDAIFVDESHEFKNLGFATSMQNPGIGDPKGSQKAADLFIKTQMVLRKTGGKNVVFATGTPISNSIAEMFTLQRYLGYEELKAQGLAHFDAWANQYGDVFGDWELTAAGNYKLKERFRSFVNMPELIQSYLTFADVILRDDINLPTPKIKGGKPTNFVVPRSKDQAEYIGVEDENGKYKEGTLVWRSENLPKGPPKRGDDNPLVIMSDARKAALDMRLIDPNYPDNPDSKVNKAVDEMMRLYKAWEKDKGTQLVFCDLSTPKNAKGEEQARIRDIIERADQGDEEAQDELDKMSPDELAALTSEFSVYDDVREKLIARGVPSEEIAYIHDAKKDEDKEILFDKVKRGKVRFLLGSTKKMGAGMNVQERLVALHHLDAPWKPSDLEQREGRIIRQGNTLYNRDPKKFEIEIMRYATKATLDSRMWQILEMKALFIEQLRKGNNKERVVDDVAGEAANAAEMKAAASGNPLILEEMDLRTKIRTLEQLKEAHNREQFQIRDDIQLLKNDFVRLKKESMKLEKDVQLAIPIEENKTPTAKIGKETLDQHKKIGEAMIEIAGEMAKAGEESREIGSIGGFKLIIDNESGTSFILTFKGEQEYQVMFGEGADASGLSVRLRNAIVGLIFRLDTMEERIKNIATDIPKLEKRVAEWPKEKELEKLKARWLLVIESLQTRRDTKGTEEDQKRTKAEKDQGETSAMRDAMANGNDVPGRKYYPQHKTIGVAQRPTDGKVKIWGRTPRTIELKPEDKPTRREGIRVMLINIIGNRLYQGKIRGKTKLGFYRRENSEVRIAGYDSVEVMAHELAHYLDMHYEHANLDFLGVPPALREELADLSYTSIDTLKYKEGFAEFVRLYLTNSKIAWQRAPFYALQFERILEQDEKLRRKIYALQDEMHRWYFQGVRAQNNATTTGAKYTPKQTLVKYGQQLPMDVARQRWIDHIHAANVVETTIKGELVSAEEGYYKELQLLNGVDGIASESYYKGAPMFNDESYIEFHGPSLSDVWGRSVKTSDKRVQEQQLYFVARRADELKGQAREKLLSEQHIRDGLSLGVKYPYFVEAFSAYQEYRKNMMDFYVDCGLISRESANRMLRANKNYVPFMRVVEKGSKIPSPGRGDPFKRLKGSERSIRPVMDTMLELDARHIAEALKRRAMRKLYRDALKSQRNEFVAGLAPDVHPADKSLVNRVVEAYTQALDEAVVNEGVVLQDNTGVDISIEALRDSSGIDELQFWTYGHRPKTVDTMVDFYLEPTYYEDEDGNIKVKTVTKWVEIQHNQRMLAEMVDALNLGHLAIPEGALGNLIKAMYMFKRLATFTITSTFNFAGGNVARDQAQAFTLSGGKYKPVWDMIKGLQLLLKSLFDENSLYHQMKAQGGPAGGRVRQQFEESIDRGLQKSDLLPLYYPARFMNALLDIYLAVMDAPEMSTRMGFYNRMINEGKNPREAAWLAREISTDFSKHGSYAAWVMYQRTVPFMGAYFQGIDRDLRAFATAKGKMSFRNLVKTESGRATLNDLKVRIWIASSLMISIPIILALLNQDNDEYESLTDDQKTRFYHLWAFGKHFTIPKQHGFVSLAGQAGEAIVDYVTGHASSKDARDTILFALAYHFGLDGGPGLTQPLYEAMVNEDFRGAPVVAREQFGVVSPAYQYTSRTPRLYVNMGEALGVSPDMTHHIVKGYLGYFSDYIDEITNAMLWDEEAWGERPGKKDALYMATKQFIPESIPYRTKWTEGYYELKHRAAQARADYSAILSREVIRNTAKVNQYLGSDMNVALINLNKMFAKIDRQFKDEEKYIASIDYNKALTGEEKDNKREAYYQQKNKLFADLYKQISKELDKIEMALVP